MLSVQPVRVKYPCRFLVFVVQSLVFRVDSQWLPWSTRLYRVQYKIGALLLRSECLISFDIIIPISSPKK